MPSLVVRTIADGIDIELGAQELMSGSVRVSSLAKRAADMALVRVK